MSRASVDYWDTHPVASCGPLTTEQGSLDLLKWRNDQYPDLHEFMPVDYPDRQIIDFGCGPGHDTMTSYCTAPLTSTRSTRPGTRSSRSATACWQRLRESLHAGLRRRG